MYLKGLGTAVDYNKAYEILNEGKEMNETACLNALGFMYLNGYGVEQDSTKAIEYINKAAKKSSEALYNLGVLYLNGSYVKRDWVQAYKYFSQSAMRQHLSAMEQQGNMLLNGMGTPKNCQRSVQIFKNICEMGPSSSLLQVLIIILFTVFLCFSSLYILFLFVFSFSIFSLYIFIIESILFIC